MNQCLTLAGPGRLAVPIRVLTIAVLGFGAACTSIAPEVVDVPPEPVIVEPAPEPTPPPVVEETPEIPAVEHPTPEIAPPSPILVLASSDASSYSDVSRALATRLAGRYDIEHVNYAELDAPARRRLDASPAKAAIAIGLDAARFAVAELNLPTIICQIYDLDPLLKSRDSVFGVAALPPPALQLETWKELAPNATSVGLFVSEGERDLAVAARRAAKNIGLELRIEYVASDRELLYRFKRVADELDALWVVPDNDILSPPVLREVFTYALMHRVHSIVFSPSLLSWGALLSTGGSAENIATTVGNVLDTITAGNADELPRVTDLTAVDVHVNDEVATSLGVSDATKLGARTEVALQ